VLLTGKPQGRLDLIVPALFLLVLRTGDFPSSPRPAADCARAVEKRWVCGAVTVISRRNDGGESVRTCGQSRHHARVVPGSYWYLWCVCV